MSVCTYEKIFFGNFHESNFEVTFPQAPTPTYHPSFSVFRNHTYNCQLRCSSCEDASHIGWDGIISRATPKDKQLYAVRVPLLFTTNTDLFPWPCCSRLESSNVLFVRFFANFRTISPILELVFLENVLMGFPPFCDYLSITLEVDIFGNAEIIKSYNRKDKILNFVEFFKFFQR